MSLRALLMESAAARHVIAGGSLVLWVLLCAVIYAGLERLLPSLLLGNPPHQPPGES
jgi:hypothetical protein